MSLAECRINPVAVNFYLQKSVDIFYKDSAEKIWSKKYEGWKFPSLMPIRVNASFVYSGPFLKFGTWKKYRWFWKNCFLQRSKIRKAGIKNSRKYVSTLVRNSNRMNKFFVDITFIRQTLIFFFTILNLAELPCQKVIQQKNWFILKNILIWCLLIYLLRHQNLILILTVLGITICCLKPKLISDRNQLTDTACSEP